MKLQRPVLASVAAVAIAAGSVSVAHTTPSETQALDDAAVTPQTDPTNRGTEIGGAPTPVPAAHPAPADAATGLDPRDVQNAVDFLVDEGAEVNLAESQETPSPSNSQKTVNGLRPLFKAPPAHNSKYFKDPVTGEMRLAGFGEDGYVPQRWFNYSGGQTYKDKDDKTQEYPKSLDAYEVFSTSMQRWIPVAVIPAKNSDGTPKKDAPTLYMLNGAGGSEQNADWVSSGDADSFFRNKGVNVVIPMEGAFSYYVDWLTDGDELKEKSRYLKGAQKWTTFLGQELQPTIEQHLEANGTRGVLGMSMSATSSLLLAQHYPGEYAAVGSFSGCAATSTPLPWAFTALTINRAGDVTPAHAWGPLGSPYNRYNDALVNAEKLAGSKVYISNASGLAAEEDMYGHRVNEKEQSPFNALRGSATTIVEGGVIEGATNSCTHDLHAKIEGINRAAGGDESKKIDADYVFRNTGTHMWDLWRDDMERSWNMTFGPAFFGEGNFEPANVKEISTWDTKGSSLSSAR